MADYFDKITKDELEEHLNVNDVILSDQSELRYRMLIRRIVWFQPSDEHIRWIRQIGYLVKHLGIFDETEFRAIWLHTGDYEFFNDEFEKDGVWVKDENPGASDQDGNTSISLVFWFTLRNNVTLFEVMTALQQLFALIYNVPLTTNLEYFVRFTDTQDEMDAIPMADYKIINSVGQWKFKENLNAINGMFGKEHNEFVFFEKLCNVFNVPITYEQYNSERAYIRRWEKVREIPQSDGTFQKEFRIVNTMKYDDTNYYGKFYIGRDIMLKSNNVIGLMWKYAVCEMILKLLSESFEVYANHGDAAFDTDMEWLATLAQHHKENITSKHFPDLMRKAAKEAKVLLMKYPTDDYVPLTSSNRMKYVEDLIAKIEYKPLKLKNDGSNHYIRQAINEAVAKYGGDTYFITSIPK